MKNKNNDKGSMTLETALVLPFFFFMFLFAFGFFGFISARNKINHALIQATKSLSMDSFVTESFNSIYDLGDDQKKNAFKAWDSMGDLFVGIIRTTTADPYFAEKTDWYKRSTSNQVIKNRFVAYYAGGDNNPADRASSNLKKMGVENGLDGMTFNYTVSGEGDLEVTLTYNLHSYFDFFGLGTFPMKSTATAKMWAYNGPS